MSSLRLRLSKARKVTYKSLYWRQNGRDGVANTKPHDCLLNRLYSHRSKKTSERRVTGFCEWNSPVTGEFPAQSASNARNVSIWWRHHVRENINASATLLRLRDMLQFALL